MRLCELKFSFITALVPIDLLGYFKSDFGHVLETVPERRNQSTYKILVTDYWSLSKQKKCSASTSNINIYIYMSGSVLLTIGESVTVNLDHVCHNN